MPIKVPSAPVVYFLWGQVGWFACILSAARGEPRLGVTVVAILIAGHLWRTSGRLEESKFLAAVIVTGALWESAVVQLGLLSYPSGNLCRGLAPYWVVALWALFGAQFNTSYLWLKSRMGLASVVGATAGPLSFRAGAALGAVHFERPWTAAFSLAIGWACLLPLLILYSRRWDGVRALS